MIKVINNYGIFFLIYIIPLMAFMIYSLKNNLRKGLVLLLSSAYLFLSVVTSGITYNLFPFIIVICSIILINRVEKNMFNLNGFHIFKASKYAIFSYIISLVISFIYIIILMNINLKVNDQKIINEMLQLPMDEFIIMSPIIIIFAPVVEEFVFRWFLYDRVLKKNIGVYWAAILSSGVFALAHFNLKSVAAIMTLGIINCWLINNRGYWYAVFNHSFFNLISVLILLLNKLT